MRNSARIVGNIFITVIFILLAAVGFELIARIVDGTRAAATAENPTTPITKEMVDKRIKNLVLAFDNEYTYDQVIKMFPMMQDQLKYAPWIQIGNADHDNPYSIVVNGIRKTSESKDCRNTSAHEQNGDNGPKTVWFFGGSTTYGIGVPWWDTIPSNFVEEADRNGACVIAINFGVSFHFSRQEAIYFVLNLMKEHKPDAVVFLDGLNDFLHPGAAIRSEPFFTPTLDKLIPVGRDLSMNTIMSRTSPSFMARLSSLFGDLHVLRWLGLAHGAPQSATGREEAYSNKKPPESEEFSTNEQVVQAVVDRYLATKDLISKVCEIYATRCFQFLQPVAALDYNPPETEILTEEVRNPTELNKRLRAGYPLMRQAFESSSAGCGAGQKSLESEDLSSLFKTYEGIPYVDYVHYAPRANKLIATEMYRCIFSKS